MIEFFFNLGVQKDVLTITQNLAMIKTDNSSYKKEYIFFELLLGRKYQKTQKTTDRLEENLRNLHDR